MDSSCWVTNAFSLGELAAAASAALESIVGPVPDLPVVEPIGLWDTTGPTPVRGPMPDVGRLLGPGQPRDVVALILRGHESDVLVWNSFDQYFGGWKVSVDTNRPEAASTVLAFAVLAAAARLGDGRIDWVDAAPRMVVDDADLTADDLLDALALRKPAASFADACEEVVRGRDSAC